MNGVMVELEFADVSVFSVTPAPLIPAGAANFNIPIKIRFAMTTGGDRTMVLDPAKHPKIDSITVTLTKPDGTPVTDYNIGTQPIPALSQNIGITTQEMPIVFVATLVNTDPVTQYKGDLVVHVSIAISDDVGSKPARIYPAPPPPGFSFRPHTHIAAEIVKVIGTKVSVVGIPGVTINGQKEVNPGSEVSISLRVANTSAPQTVSLSNIQFSNPAIVASGVSLPILIGATQSGDFSFLATVPSNAIPGEDISFTADLVVQNSPIPYQSPLIIKVSGPQLLVTLKAPALVRIGQIFPYLIKLTNKSRTEMTDIRLLVTNSLSSSGVEFSPSLDAPTPISLKPGQSKSLIRFFQVPQDPTLLGLEMDVHAIAQGRVDGVLIDGIPPLVGIAIFNESPTSLSVDANFTLANPNVNNPQRYIADCRLKIWNNTLNNLITGVIVSIVSVLKDGTTIIQDKAQYFSPSHQAMCGFFSANPTPGPPSKPFSLTRTGSTSGIVFGYRFPIANDFSAQNLKVETTITLRIDGIDGNQVYKAVNTIGQLPPFVPS